MFSLCDKWLYSDVGTSHTFRSQSLLSTQTLYFSFLVRHSMVSDVERLYEHLNPMLKVIFFN